MKLSKELRIALMSSTLAGIGIGMIIGYILGKRNSQDEDEYEEFDIMETVHCDELGEKLFTKNEVVKLIAENLSSKDEIVKLIVENLFSKDEVDKLVADALEKEAKKNISNAVGGMVINNSLASVANSQPIWTPNPLDNSFIIKAANALESYGEEETRTYSPDHPYLVREEDVFKTGMNPNDIEQLTYFMKDDVLIDQFGEIVVNRSTVVGTEFVDNFGYGSNDNTVVYVHNPKTNRDYEITLELGSYEMEVLEADEDQYMNAKKYFNLG